MRENYVGDFTEHEDLDIIIHGRLYRAEFPHGSEADIIVMELGRQSPLPHRPPSIIFDRTPIAIQYPSAQLTAIHIKSPTFQIA